MSQQEAGADERIRDLARRAAARDIDAARELVAELEREHGATVPPAAGADVTHVVVVCDDKQSFRFMPEHRVVVRGRGDIPASEVKVGDVLALGAKVLAVHERPHRRPFVVLSFREDYRVEFHGDSRPRRLGSADLDFHQAESVDSAARYIVGRLLGDVDAPHLNLVLAGWEHVLHMARFGVGHRASDGASSVHAIAASPGEPFDTYDEQAAEEAMVEALGREVRDRVERILAEAAEDKQRKEREAAQRAAEAEAAAARERRRKQFEALKAEFGNDTGGG